ncbi:MAG: DUF2934 domain-containing protein [Pseudomonadota bacterium]|nr:DUF2934 domain-containing protein [Pseudomonadota bacterium]
MASTRKTAKTSGSTGPSRRGAPRKSATVPQPGVRKNAGKAAVASSSSGEIDFSERRMMIAEAAYYRAEHRGFEPGNELEDWLGAESELESATFGRP